MCAPAGSGKTVLLRSWVESAGRADRVAWISVERGERDAQRFWLSVIDALADAVGQMAPSSASTATPAFGGQAVVEQLLSDLRSLERPVVLVIDDLHELRSTEALRLLELFLAELPPQLRVVLATREDPGSGCTGCGSPGALTEIRAERSAVLAEETRELLDASGVDALRRGRGAAPRADRRLGRGPAAGGDLARPAPRPRALRGRVLRQRAHRGGLPAGGGAGAPAAGGARPAPAHVGPGAGQRPARRRPDRRRRF